MKANSTIDGGQYSVFQLGHHWPQDDTNEWFSEAVTAGDIETNNMGKMHDPNEPASIRIKVVGATLQAVTGDWVLRSPDGEIFALIQADFDVMFSLSEE